jgi:[SSU ribosomal protein S18P]-alanine acetyltransferase (EC 2.3.1.128)
MIVEALIEKAREIDIAEMTLEVRASNENSEEFNAKYGFKIAGIRKEYYQDNKEDAIIMWKSMKELG